MTALPPRARSACRSRLDACGTVGDGATSSGRARSCTRSAREPLRFSTSALLRPIVQDTPAARRRRTSAARPRSATSPSWGRSTTLRADRRRSWSRAPASAASTRDAPAARAQLGMDARRLARPEARAVARIGGARPRAAAALGRAPTRGHRHRSRRRGLTAAVAASARRPNSSAPRRARAPTVARALDRLTDARTRAQLAMRDDVAPSPPRSPGGGARARAASRRSAPTPGRRWPAGSAPPHSSASCSSGWARGPVHDRAPEICSLDRGRGPPPRWRRLFLHLRRQRRHRRRDRDRAGTPRPRRTRVQRRACRDARPPSPRGPSRVPPGRLPRTIRSSSTSPTRWRSPRRSSRWRAASSSTSSTPTTRSPRGQRRTSPARCWSPTTAGGGPAHRHDAARHRHHAGGQRSSFLPLTPLLHRAQRRGHRALALARAARRDATMGLPDALAIDVVPNFVDTDRFAPRRGARRATRAPTRRAGSRLELPAAQAHRRRGERLRPRARRAARAPASGRRRSRARAASPSWRGSGSARDVEFLGEQVDLRDALPAPTSSCCPAPGELRPRRARGDGLRRPGRRVGRGRSARGHRRRRGGLPPPGRRRRRHGRRRGPPARRRAAPPPHGRPPPAAAPRPSSAPTPPSTATWNLPPRPRLIQEQEQIRLRFPSPLGRGVG